MKRYRFLGDESTVWKRLPLTQLSHDQWQRLFDFSALAMVVIVACAMIVSTILWFGVDFRAFYVAGRLTLEGRDPYDYDLAVPLLIELSGSVGNAPFYYPPWFALTMVPFALFSYPVARVLWLVWLVALWGLTIWFSLSALNWHIRGWRLWLMILSMLYMLAWVCIRSEQTGPMLSFTLALALWSIKEDRPVLGGLALALLLTKPQVVVLPWLVLIAHTFRQRRYPVLISTCAWLSGLLIVSTWVIPGWYTYVLRGDFGVGLKSMIEGPGNVIGKRLTSTLLDLLWVLGLPEGGANAVWVATSVIGLGGLFLLWLGKASPLYTLALSVPVWFLVTPYSMQYDYVLMTFSMMWIYRQIGRIRGWRAWTMAGILLFMHSLLLWEKLSTEGLWLPVGASLLLVWLGWGMERSDGTLSWDERPDGPGEPAAVRRAGGSGIRSGSGR